MFKLYKMIVLIGSYLNCSRIVNFKVGSEGHTKTGPHITKLYIKTLCLPVHILPGQIVSPFLIIHPQVAFQYAYRICRIRQ